MKRQKTECNKCNRLISNSNYTRHINSCGTDTKLFTCDNWLQNNVWVCPECKLEYLTRNAVSSHYWRKHTEQGLNLSFNPPSNENGRHISWNKGKTQAEFPSLARPNQLGKKFGAALTGHTTESKRKISEKLSINNKGGRAKWYEVAGQKVQGTWERNVAQKLEDLGISWLKLKTNKDILKYEMDGKLRSYTPDFYLPTYNVYLEVKGHWWGRDREKMDIVLKTYPDKKIVILEKEQYERFLGGELVW